MDHPTIPAEILAAIKNLAAALAPSAIGATVAVALKGGLSWTQRLIQIAIGICVSWYVRLAFEAIFDVGDFMGQAIGFTAGLIAYDALPRFRERAIAVVAELPDIARAWLRRRREESE
ncbi:MAG: hypothetical protein E6G92_04280 [Alphaproteobacteria bacterium]|nr:MAG: hypothetical protein E6G92_04280 [Alphaproteobacteria bacterium]